MARHRSGTEMVKYSYYKNIYNTCYNIESARPRTDVCDTCFSLEAMIRSARDKGKDYTELEQKLKLHKKKADIAYLEMNEAKDKNIWDPKEWTIICMDLQQTHMCPKTAVGSFFYKRKLNIYNFCICDVKTKEPYFYMWEEYKARKGSSEIYSCLYKWLSDHVFIHTDRPKKLRIIADNCGGQNKNNNLALALLRLVHLNLFHRIELAFLVPGHSYMPCDQNFGIISNKLKKYQEIASPDRLVDLIKNARNDKKGQFQVKKLERSDFLNIDVLNSTAKEQRVAYIRPTKGKIFQTASVIVMKASCPEGYILKQNFEETDLQGTYTHVALPVKENVNKQKFDLGKITLNPKYPSELKLAPEKPGHLNEMRSYLYDEGNWIEELMQRQRQLEGDVIEECDIDDSEQLFPQVFESDVVKRLDPTNMESQSNS